MVDYEKVDLKKIASVIKRLRCTEIGTEEDVESLCKNFAKEMSNIGLNPDALVPNDSLRMFLLKVFNDGGDVINALETILENKEEDHILVSYSKEELSLSEMEAAVAREEQAGHFKAALEMQKRITEHYRSKKNPGPIASMVSGTCQ